MMLEPPRRRAWSIALLAAAFLCVACDDEPEATQAADPPPPTVTVASVVERPITPSITFNGRIEAVDEVVLRARVEGFIEQRLFREGQDVRVGDLLFVLEKAPYEAEIAQIKGQIRAAEGSLRLAQIEVDRQRTLVRRQASARATLDEAQARYSQAEGELQRLQATLARAELNLDYTDISAPIDGRIGRAAFSVGDFVDPASESLATIVRQDPMYVAFPVTSRTLLEVLRRADETAQDPRAVRVRLRLADGSIYGKTGTINFVDVQTDATTDTVTVRATIPNTEVGGSEHLLLPNALVSVIVEQADPEQALVIPQQAILIDQSGSYVLVVDQQSRVQQRRIRPGTTIGAGITVIDGLSAGDQVVVGGQQKVRPGQVVAASASPDTLGEP